MKFTFLLLLCCIFMCSCTKPIDRHPDAKELFEEIRVMSQNPAKPEAVEEMERRLAAIKYHGLKDSVKVAHKLIDDMDVYVLTGTLMTDPASGEEYSDRTEMSTFKYADYKSGKEEITKYMTDIHQDKDIDVDKAASLYYQYHWDNETCKLVSEHKVQLGFNKAQVKEALGKPLEIKEERDGSSVYADWVYKDVTIHFANDELVKFKSNAESNNEFINEPSDTYKRPSLK
jgi:hypothetical protein